MVVAKRGTRVALGGHLGNGHPTIRPQFWPASKSSTWNGSRRWRASIYAEQLRPSDFANRCRRRVQVRVLARANQRESDDPLAAESAHARVPATRPSTPSLRGCAQLLRRQSDSRARATFLFEMADRPRPGDRDDVAPRANIHASRELRRVTPSVLAIATTCAAISRFPSKVSGCQRGADARMSPGAMSDSDCSVPLSQPRLIGLYATTGSPARAAPRSRRRLHDPVEE